MAEHVISHRAPRRKRGKRGFLLRRFGALAVTVAALATATWLAPYINRRPPPPLATQTAGPGTTPALPPPSGTTEVTLLITADQPAAQAPRPRRTRRGVPLDAHPGDAGEDFEILSAGELDAISQAGN
jgi:hypothetical protein